MAQICPSDDTKTWLAEMPGTAIQASVQTLICPVVQPPLPRPRYHTLPPVEMKGTSLGPTESDVTGAGGGGLVHWLHTSLASAVAALSAAARPSAPATR